MITPLIIQFLIFWIYVIFTWIYNKKVLPSISDSWYEFPGKSKWLFSIFSIGLGVPMFFQETGWFFGAGASSFFLAIAPAFKDKLVKTVHGAGAVGLIAFALIGLTAKGVWLPLACCGPISIFLRYSGIKNETTWVEVANAMLIFGGLYVLRTRDTDPLPIVERILGVASV